MSCVQIICNSKDDFPCVNENFQFRESTHKVLAVKISYFARRLGVYFVNVFISEESI